MKKKSTKAEDLLWEKLRNKTIGYEIRRQHVIGKFICDFVCLEKQLVIELDEATHHLQKEEDRRREELIGDKKFSVLRFTHEEVYDNIDFVVSAIKETLHQSSPSSLRVEEGSKANLLFCPMIDAKRMEVYCAVYDRELREIKKTSAEIMDENSFSTLLTQNKIYFFGDGAEKCRSTMKHPNGFFLENIHPSAQFMLPIAERLFSENKFENLAYFEPFYLKDFTGVKTK